MRKSELSAHSSTIYIYIYIYTRHIKGIHLQSKLQHTCNLTSRSMTAPLSVSSPSSILPPHRLITLSYPHARIRDAFQKCYTSFYFFFNCVSLKLREQKLRESVKCLCTYFVHFHGFLLNSVGPHVSSTIRSLIRVIRIKFNTLQLLFYTAGLNKFSSTKL